MYSSSITSSNYSNSSSNNSYNDVNKSVFLDGSYSRVLEEVKEGYGLGRNEKQELSILCVKLREELFSEQMVGGSSSSSSSSVNAKGDGNGFDDDRDFYSLGPKRRAGI